MMRGTLAIFAGVPFVIAGIIVIKLTGMDAAWALIALGAIISCYGGVQNSLDSGKV